jgi:hypothetical protein
MASFIFFRVTTGTVRILSFSLQTCRPFSAFYFFDIKVQIGGDESDYLISALDFLNGVAFPSWPGSLYPIVISPNNCDSGVGSFSIEKLFNRACACQYLAFSQNIIKMDFYR